MSNPDQLATIIDGLVNIIDKTLWDMKGSASFPQGQSRHEILSAHFRDGFEDKVIEAIITLITSDEATLYEGPIEHFPYY